MVVRLEDRVLVISVYLDESGTHEGSEGASMGGLLFFPDKWAEFEKQWRRALDLWGLEYFHMTDFESYHGPYEHWTPGEHKERLSHLLDLIESYSMGLVGLGLPTEIYEEAVVADDRDKLTPYHLLAWQCFVEASKVTAWAGHEIKRLSPDTNLEDVRTAFVYEEVSKGSGPALATYNVIKRLPEVRDSWRFVSLAYQPKEKFGALQGADILAYELYKDLPLVHTGSKLKPRYPLGRLLSTDHPTRVGLWTRNDMKSRIGGLRTLLIELHERGVKFRPGDTSHD